MDILGIFMFGRKFFMFFYFLRLFSIISLLVWYFLFLLKLEFLEEGFNMFIYEIVVYSKFVKYVRDVLSGCRVVIFGNIFEFVIGISE